MPTGVRIPSILAASLALVVAVTMWSAPTHAVAPTIEVSGSGRWVHSPGVFTNVSVEVRADGPSVSGILRVEDHGRGRPSRIVVDVDCMTQVDSNVAWLSGLVTRTSDGFLANSRVSILVQDNPGDQPDAFSSITFWFGEPPIPCESSTSFVGPWQPLSKGSFSILITQPAHGLVPFSTDTSHP